MSAAPQLSKSRDLPLRTKLLICFLAVVVGGIVIAMFAPMVKMIDKLGG